MSSLSWLLVVKNTSPDSFMENKCVVSDDLFGVFSVLGKLVVEMQTFEKYFMIWDVIAIQNSAGWVVITFELLLNA